MALRAAAFPIPPGKTADWRRFNGELNGARRSEYVASRKALGVRERVFFQPTPTGDLVVVTLEGDDPGTAFARFTAKTDAFTRWFLEQVKDVHGVDLAQVALGPMPEQVGDTGA